LASRDQKRTRTSSSRRSRASKPSPETESTEDALEKLFAEAMGSVQAAKRKPRKRTPKRPPKPPPLEVEVDLDIEEAFLEESSVHFIIEDSSKMEIVLGDSLDESGTSFDDLDDELLAARGGGEEDSHDDADDNVEIERFIRESFGANTLSDDDPELAFPTFDDAPVPEQAEDAGPEEPLGPPPEAKPELFAVGDDSAPLAVPEDVGRRTKGDAKKKAKKSAKKKKKKKKKTALPGPSLEDALTARLATLGRTVEERDLEVRAARDRINTLNAQVVAASRRGASISREFETFRRRAERERKEHKKYAAEKVLKEFLGVYDNLSRALEHAGDDASGAFGQGVSMTLHQFASALRLHGVERVTAEPGSTFDPIHHEAVGQFFSDDAPIGTIVTEMQAGFMLHGRLLRAALVTVSRGREGEATDAEKDGEFVEDVAAEDAAEEDGRGDDVEAVDETTNGLEEGTDAPEEATDPGKETADEVDKAADEAEEAADEAADEAEEAADEAEEAADEAEEAADEAEEAADEAEEAADEAEEAADEAEDGDEGDEAESEEAADGPEKPVDEAGQETAGSSPTPGQEDSVSAS
jgi:molecular chaperone GrpE